MSKDRTKNIPEQTRQKALEKARETRIAKADDRRREVARLWAEGVPKSKIAGRLGVNWETVNRDIKAMTATEAPETPDAVSVVIEATLAIARAEARGDLSETEAKAATRSVIERLVARQ